jgi:hypothetical protein
MKNCRGTIAGMAVASLLVALPAAAQYSSGGSSEGSSKGSSGSTGSSGSMGTGSSGSSSGSMGTGSQMSEQPSTSKQNVMGTVDKVDASSNQLSIQPKIDTGMHSKTDSGMQSMNESIRLKTSSSTQVTKDGQKATLSDVKEGDEVRASLSPSGTVQRIDVVSGSSGGMHHPSGPSGTTGGSSPGGMGSESK